MKHTNFNAKANEVKYQEQEELQRAVTAHGGIYEWNTEKDSSLPVIAINADKSYPQPQDVQINKVAIANNHLKIYGVAIEDNSPVKFTVDDVFAGHLSFVIDNIPETKEISDVSLPLPSIPYKPVVGDKIWLSNTDRRDKANDRYGEVIKIGRKFFYVKTGIYSEERFEINTLKHDNGECSPYYELYTSQEACEYSQKAATSRRLISNHLYKLLTDKEAIELYNMLSERDKHD